MRIKELRQQAGLTQAELAAAIGVSRAALAMWECGKSWPQTQILPTLAEKLKCRVDDLYASKDSTKREVSPCTAEA